MNNVTLLNCSLTLFDKEMTSLGQIHKVNLSAVGQNDLKQVPKTRDIPNGRRSKTKSGPMSAGSYLPPFLESRGYQVQLLILVEEPAITNLSLSLCIVGQQIWVNSKILRL